MKERIIKNPRITEKGSMLMESNVYVFDVEKNANKNEVKKAIFSIYKVKPVKVNIVKVEEKKIMTRGKVGVKSGGKKALVYLETGDKIEFI
jgi:large subunit ribosomal protein L23